MFCYPTFNKIFLSISYCSQNIELVRPCAHSRYAWVNVALIHNCVTLSLLLNVTIHHFAIWCRASRDLGRASRLSLLQVVLYITRTFLTFNPQHMIFIPVSDCSCSWCVTLVFSCIILVFHPLFNTDQSGFSLSWSAWVAAPTLGVGIFLIVLRCHHKDLISQLSSTVAQPPGCDRENRWIQVSLH